MHKVSICLTDIFMRLIGNIRVLSRSCFHSDYLLCKVATDAWRWNLSPCDSKHSNSTVVSHLKRFAVPLRSSHLVSFQMDTFLRDLLHFTACWASSRSAAPSRREDCAEVVPRPGRWVAVWCKACERSGSTGTDTDGRGTPRWCCRN